MSCTLSGHFINPDGSAVALGTLILTLNSNAVESGTGWVVPKRVSITLNSSGAIPAATTIIGNDSLTPSGTTYAAQVVAVGGTYYSLGNFSITGGTFNFDTATPSGGGITYPFAVLQNPSSAQSVTGETLSLVDAPLNLDSNSPLAASGTASFTGVLTATAVKNMNNIQFVGEAFNAVWGSSDLGAQINAAYAALPFDSGTSFGGGEIVITPKAGGTPYTYTTPIVLATSGKWVTLRGEAGSAIDVIFNGAGTALLLDYVPAIGGGWKTGHGLRDFNLYNKTKTQTVGGPNKATEITAWSITSNVVTFTCNPNPAGTNVFTAGDVVTLNGFQFNASTSGDDLFNNVQVTVLSSGLSSTQFKANFTHANTSLTEFGFAYTTTETNVGVEFGPTNSGAQNGTISNVQVSGFFKNIKFNNGTGVSWGVNFNQVSSVSGTFGYWWPDSNDMENIRISSGLIAWNAVGVYCGYAFLTDLIITGPSFDSNTITGLSAPFGGSFSFSDLHLENNGVFTKSATHFINAFPTKMSMSGGFIKVNGVVASDFLVRIGGGAFTALGTNMFSGATITNGFQIESGAVATLAVWNDNGSAVTNIYGGAGSVNQILPLAIKATLKQGTNGGNYTHSGDTSLTTVDGTNLSYTVTIPVGWKLLIAASGNLGQNTAALANGTTVALVDGVTTLQTVTMTVEAAGDANPFALNWVITGDGSSHTITLKYATSNASDAVIIYNSSGLIPVMTFFLTPSA